MNALSLREQDDDDARRARLEAAVRGAADNGIVVAVSGGVDSLTLAAFVHGVAVRAGLRARFVFAESPAVPKDASARVSAVAAACGFVVDVIDAGEFNDPRYRENPINRCYFCKSHLFDAVRAHVGDGPVVCTGANVDDLSDHRPGRVAARERGVCEPFVDAGFTKDHVRALARHLGLGEVAELPSSPCLSSRVETGIAIDAATLALVDAVEVAVRAAGVAGNVRCRVRGSGLVVEVDVGVDVDVVAAVARAAAGDRAVRVARYQRGSAFVSPTSSLPVLP
jgi:uncharacterized protein